MTVIVRDIPSGSFECTLTITARMSRRLAFRVAVAKVLIQLGVWLLKGNMYLINQDKKHI